MQEHFASERGLVADLSAARDAKRPKAVAGRCRNPESMYVAQDRLSKGARGAVLDESGRRSLSPVRARRTESPKRMSPAKQRPPDREIKRAQDALHEAYDDLLALSPARMSRQLEGNDGEDDVGGGLLEGDAGYASDGRLNMSSTDNWLDGYPGDAMDSAHVSDGKCHRRDLGGPSGRGGAGGNNGNQGGDPAKVVMQQILPAYLMAVHGGSHHKVRGALGAKGKRGQKVMQGGKLVRYADNRQSLGQEQSSFARACASEYEGRVSIGSYQHSEARRAKETPIVQTKETKTKGGIARRSNGRLGVEEALIARSWAAPDFDDGSEEEQVWGRGVREMQEVRGAWAGG